MLVTSTFEDNCFFSEHWNPEALLVKIAEAQENGETNVNLEKIVAKDEESVSSVGPRRALVRAFASLLSKLIILKSFCG